MKTWKDDLRRCFGAIDGKFAIHPADERRAFALLGRLREEQVEWDEVEQAIRDHLKDANDKHVKKQVEHAARKFKPWLIA